MSLKDDLRDMRMDPPGGYGYWDQDEEEPKPEVCEECGEEPSKCYCKFNPL